MKTEKQKTTMQIKTTISSSIHYSKKLKQLTGYTIEELKNHLAKKFKPGMNWDNYEKWHIDHIIPISKFKYESIKDKAFKECWALKNLQPLWASENIKKGGTNRRFIPPTKVMKLWNGGKKVHEITKILHSSSRKIRWMIIEQIGHKKYQERCNSNLTKANLKRKQTRAKKEKQMIIIREQIKDLIKNKNISIYKIAYESNLSFVSIYNFLNGKTQMRTYNLKKIFDVLKS